MSDVFSIFMKVQVSLPTFVSVLNVKFYQNRSSSAVAEIGMWTDKDRYTLFPCVLVVPDANVKDRKHCEGSELNMCVVH